MQPQEDALIETPEDDIAEDVQPADLEHDVANLDDMDFSLHGELTMDLQVILELCEDTIDET